MDEKTTSKYTFTMREILDSLGIAGEVLSCGFNTQKKYNSPLDREFTVVIKRREKLLVMGKVNIQIKKAGNQNGSQM